ncbi:hypothetical protein [Streptomyces sp. NPDC019507]|uniref:hypothetical protein n=1 Tax=Streptomyces sp. NPDC019507 TaxID=3154689 RepID=UPI0033FC665E
MVHSSLRGRSGLGRNNVDVARSLGRLEPELTIFHDNLVQCVGECLIVGLELLDLHERLGQEFLGLHQLPPEPLLAVGMSPRVWTFS